MSQTNFFKGTLMRNCKNQKQLADYIASMDDATFKKLIHAMTWSHKIESKATWLFGEI